MPDQLIRLPNGQTGRFPADATPDEIEEIIAAQFPKEIADARAKEIPSGAGDPPGVAGRVNARVRAMGFPEPTDREPDEYKVGRFVRNNLPAIAATGMGLATGGASLPVSAALVGLAGAGGRGGQIAMDAMDGRVSPSAVDDLKDMGTQGMVQGATEFIGRPSLEYLTRFAKSLYHGILKPSKGLRDKYGSDAIVDELMHANRPIRTQGGTEKAWGAMERSKSAADAMVQEAAPLAPNVTARDIIPGLNPVRDELRTRAMIGAKPSQVPEVGAAARRIREELGTRVPSVSPVAPKVTSTPAALVGPSGTPAAGLGAVYRPGSTSVRMVRTGPTKTVLKNTGVDLLKAHEIGRAADAGADAAERQLDRGIIQELTPDNMIDRAIGDQYRKVIPERVRAATGRDLARQNATTRIRYGAAQALKDANERLANNAAVGGAREVTSAVPPMMLAPTLGQGAVIPTWLTLRALASPRVGSSAAIGLRHLGESPMTLPALRALAGLMSSHGDDATP